MEEEQGEEVYKAVAATNDDDDPARAPKKESRREREWEREGMQTAQQGSCVRAHTTQSERDRNREKTGREDKTKTRVFLTAHT